MTRRILLCVVFASIALTSTGCCGIFRNFVYRIRHCGGGSYPAYGIGATGGAGCGTEACSPGYGVTPVFAGAAGVHAIDGGSVSHEGGFGGGYAAPGCAGCSASAAPMSHGFGGYAVAPVGPQNFSGYAGVPSVPAMGQPGVATYNGVPAYNGAPNYLGAPSYTGAPPANGAVFPGINGKYAGTK